MLLFLPIQDNQQEDVPQYPITTRTYYVEFMFLEDFQAKSKPESAILKTPQEKGDETKDADQEKDVVAKEEETKASGEGDKKDKPDAAPGTGRGKKDNSSKKHTYIYNTQPLFILVQ